MELNVESRILRIIGVNTTLGGMPASKKIREEYVTSKAPKPEIAEMESQINDYELNEKGVTVFARNEKGEVCWMSHHIKGYFKEAFSALKDQLGIANIKGKVDTLIFVEPHFIPIKRSDGTTITEPDGRLERTLRANTMQGPKTALQSSEKIETPWQIEIEISLIPNQGTPKSKPVTWDAIETALEYGAYYGISQWRSAGYGRFRYEWVEE